MVSLIQQNPYFAFLIATILEWPIVTFISAGLASRHILYLPYVVGITILGDVIGDIVLFLLGRYWSQISLVQYFLHKLPRKEKITRSLQKNPFLYLSIAKITPYLSTPTLIFTGTQSMGFGRFFIYSMMISVLVKSIYITLWYIGFLSISQIEGFLSGRAKIILYLIGSISFFLATKLIYRLLIRYIRKCCK